MKPNDDRQEEKAEIKQVVSFKRKPGTFPEMVVGEAFFESMTPEELADWEDQE